MRLSRWLDVWECHGVAGEDYIPAVEIGRVRAQGLVDALDGKGAGLGQLWDAYQAYRAAVPDTVQWVPRWDVCAPEGVKYLMSSAASEGQWDPQMLDWTIDDSRLIDILFDEMPPGGEDWWIPLYARPWHRAAVVDGYPVEFRVYLLDGVVRGVSSYYPQRPLGDEWLPWAYACWYVAGQFGSEFPNCTLDFIVPHERADDPPSPENPPLWLESGPHHGEARGAHPCCFMPGKTNGVALRLQPGAIEPPGRRRAGEILAMLTEQDDSPETHFACTPPAACVEGAAHAAE
ncbi:MAG: hypothetical protein GF320_11330 [Armatimonadia bacterium]|nr:hypothetical protein [Armatimonadia bacterium]